MDGTCESFIAFCDEMQIATESNAFTDGVGKIIAWVQRTLLTIIRKIREWLANSLAKRNGKIRKALYDLLGKAEKALESSKHLKGETHNDKVDSDTQKRAEDCARTVQEINEEYNDMWKFLNSVHDTSMPESEKVKIRDNYTRKYHLSPDDYPVTKKELYDWLDRDEGSSKALDEWDKKMKSNKPLLS